LFYLRAQDRRHPSKAWLSRERAMGFVED